MRGLPTALAALMSTATIPEEYRDVLNTTALAHVATIGPDGAPQSNPVWFDWDGERPFHQPGDQRVIVSVAPRHTTHMG